MASKARADIETMIRAELEKDSLCADFEFGLSPEGTLFSLETGHAVHPCFLRAVELARRFSGKDVVEE